MATNHPACKECVLNHDGCLFQDDDDVESCGDVQDYRKPDKEEK